MEYNKRPVPSFYRAEDGAEPFPGIYPNALFPEVSRRVFADSLAMKGLIGSIAEKNEIPYHGPLRALANVNRPEDLRELQT